MLKKVFFLMMSSIISFPIWSQTDEQDQWDAFNTIIPSHQRIEITVSDKTEYGDRSVESYSIKLIINKDYSVSFLTSFSRFKSGYLIINGSCVASGTVKWDDYSKEMSIELKGWADADFTYDEYSNVNKDLKGREFKGSDRVYQRLHLRYDKSSNRFYVTGFNPLKITIRTLNYDVFLPISKLEGRTANCAFF